MAMPNINPILEAAGNLQQQAQVSTNQIVDVFGALNALSREEAERQLDIGNNLQIIEGVKQVAEKNTQEIKLRKANELGIDPSAKADVLTALAKTISESYAQKDAALQKIQQKRSVSFTTDPLGWLVNQFTINDDIKQHNAADARGDAAVAEYSRINTLTQASNLTHTQLQQNITEASIAATKQNIANTAAIQAKQALQRGLTYNAQGIQAVLSAKSQELSAVQAVFGAETSQAQLELALQNAARTREEFEWRKQEKSLQEQEDNVIIEKINRGAQIRMGEGAKLLRAGTPEAKTAISLLKSGSPVAKSIQDDYLRGEQGILAPSPSLALDTIKTQSVNLSPAQYPVRQVLEQALATVQNMPGFDPKNKAAVTAAIDSVTKQIIDGQLKKINPNDPSNIFNIPSLSQVIKNVPELQALPVVQKVLAPRAKAGDNLSQPADVFIAVAKAVQSGELSYAEALDMPLIYQRAVGINLAAKNLDNFGIVPSKELSKYGYRVELASSTKLFAAKEIVDLTKIDMFARMLNKAMAQAAVDAQIERNKGAGLFGEVGRNFDSSSLQFGPQITNVPPEDAKSIYGR